MNVRLGTGTDTWRSLHGETCFKRLMNVYSDLWAEYPGTCPEIVIMAVQMTLRTSDNLPQLQ